MNLQNQNKWGLEVGIKRYLEPDVFTNFNNPNISRLVSSIIPEDTSYTQTINILFNFVRNNIWFCGSPTKINTSQITINTGKGSGASKSILLVSMLRCAGIPAKLTAHLTSCENFKNLIPPVLKRFSTMEYLHFQPLVWVNKSWINLENCMLDKKYLDALILKHSLSHEATGFGFSHQGSLSKLRANLSFWDVDTTALLMQNSILSNLGEITDETDIIQKYSKKGFISDLICKVISKNILKVRSCL